MHVALSAFMERSAPNPEARAPARASTSSQRQMPAWANKLALGAIMLALGYGGGLLHGWQLGLAPQQQLSEQIHSREQERDRARGELLVLKASNAELSDTVGLHEVYRSLQQALNALDARNFGTAESFVRASEGRLRTLATQMPRLVPVMEQVAKLRLEVAENLGGQRAQLAELVETVGALISEPPLARRHAPVTSAP